MNSFYTKISAKVPTDYTKPTTSFTKHVWLSVFGLLFFIGLYLGLTIWFGKLAYNLFLDAYNFDGHFWNYLLAIGFGFLSLFMAKSLFFLNKREENPIHRYVNEKEEPVLFDYLYKLADEAGAPRPHKVFLTDRVNASVSYDISLINLLIPSKKNLEIGLGLVNVLNLGEFKAVLAHEFGHFAQRSMLLGRYVYVAQQIAARIVGKRDGFDTFLAGLSRIDLRIAWIGWILSILVWAIRSLIETCFSIVVVAERALSREMEFQADLVAVSLTGSDALIHALYKLQIADQAYDNALECVNEELTDKKAVKDMYLLQTNHIQQMAKTLDDSNYGKSPVLPKDNLESHRIFTSKKYNPPKMWSTHPADVDRENNAKKTYIYEPVDDKSSWDLFSDPKSYREDMTARLIKTANIETTLVEDEDVLKNQNNEHFHWTFLDSKYHSTFLNRFAFLNFKSSEDLFEGNVSKYSLEDGFKKIYPKTIVEKINNLQEIDEEITALVISESESLTLEKRRVWHRGNQIKRKDIPETLTGLKKEVSDIQNELADHDALCRTLHYKAAEKINKSWSDYLKKLTSLVHYSEHCISNLNDVANKFNNVLTIALADGNISSKELIDILSVSDDYYYVLKRIYKDSEKLNLNAKLLKNMKVDSYQSMFEDFKLGAPIKENINDWVSVVGGWASVALKALHKLRNESLELLLDTEDVIKENYLNNKGLKETPAIFGIPQDYPTLVPGNERKIQRKLGAWDRFATGDGLVPSIAKFGIAGGILFAAIFFGSYSQKLPFYIYNGLQTDVSVNIDNTTISLKPNTTETIQLNYGKTYQINTTTYEGDLIENEAFNFNEHNSFIYNIANAAVFIERPIFYGYSYTPEGVNDSEILGVKKLFTVKADYILEEPPSQISLSSGSSGERKEFVTAYSNEAPENLLSIIENKEDQEEMIKSHSQWDDGDGENVLSWIYYLANIEDGYKIAESRLAKSPNELISMRAIQDLSDSISHKSICEKHTQLSQDNPDNANYYYLATRCIEDELQKDEQFIAGYKKWQDHSWLAYASGYVYIERNDLKSAYNAYEAVQKNKPLSEVIAIDAERIKRMLNSKNKEDYNTLINNADIAFYNSLETGDIEGEELNSDYVYYLMNKGELAEAYKLSLNHENISGYVQYLIAASKGASKEMKDTVIKNEELIGLNLNSVWSAVGLAVKENRDYKKYLEAFAPLELEDGFIGRLINLIKAKKYSEIEKHISKLQLRWRLQTYVMASVILDGNIPKTWKDTYKSGLFANEKPYLN